MSQPIGVLLMAYGTPDSLDDVDAYYTHIRHGKRPSEELIQGLRERYATVGGQTPLSEISEATRAALEDQLNRTGDQQYRVVLGMKHWKPWIKDAVRELAADGVQRAVGLVLAPHYSSMSIADYYRYIDQAQGDLGTHIQIDQIDSWHLHPPFLWSVTQRIREGLEQFPTGEQVAVVFTAHSLPERIIEQDDPYPSQLRETSTMLAAMLDLPDWTFAYQSAGHTPEPWLGPDLLDVIAELAKRGVRNILVSPIGFVSDHLEILYDIDHEAKAEAQRLGVNLKRTESLNASEDFVSGLKELVLDRSRVP